MQEIRSFTYIWSTGAKTQTITISSSGIYSVTVSNGNCNIKSSINVAINSLPTETISGGGTVCAGSSLPNVNINLMGTAP